MPSEENDSVVWIRELVAGNELVMHEFWREYATSLERIAQSRMTPALQRRVSGEEIALSVCRTFLRRARQGQFVVEGSESLWRLLCAITLTKVRHYARFHYRQKRGLHLEVALNGEESSQGLGPADPPAHHEVSPADALAFADQMSFLLGKLDDEERQIVEGKLDGMTHGEVAAKLGCSERTVRRLLERIFARWSRELDESLHA